MSAAIENTEQMTFASQDGDLVKEQINENTVIVLTERVDSGRCAVLIHGRTIGRCWPRFFFFHATALRYRPRATRHSKVIADRMLGELGHGLKLTTNCANLVSCVCLLR